MKRRFILVFMIAIWLGTLILLIPSPSRGVTLVAMLLIMGLPTWMLDWPAIYFLALLSFPISGLLMVAISWGVIHLANRAKWTTLLVVLVDVVILFLFLALAIAFWL